MPFIHGHALLIGIGTYRYEPRLNVPITAADAEAVAEVLRDPAFCGYPPDQVKLLRDDASSRQGVLASLDDLAARAGEGDTVVLFFCEHGDYGDDGDYYLTTHDTRMQRGKVVSGSGLRQSELIEKLRLVKAKRLLLVVNACHSGELAPTLGEGEAPHTGAPLPAQTAAALLATGEGRIIITACREEQFSYIGKGALTLFTQALVDGLRGRGTSSNRGYLSAYDLYTHLYYTVEEAVRQTYGRKQEPELTVLKGVGPFAVALYRGATTLGEFQSAATAPQDAAVREVSPERARAALQQHPGDNYSANLTGSGASAQGPGATAVGAGGVYVGGKNSGSINTGTRIDTGGGAYVGGSVSAGGDFVGRDKGPEGASHAEELKPIAPPPPTPAVSSSGGGVGSTLSVPEGFEATHVASEPEPVLLGVSAPRAVKAGASFIARFAAYVKAVESELAAKLKALGDEEAGISLRIPPYDTARWPIGTPVTVRVSGEGLTAQPAQSRFVWSGSQNLVSFVITTDRARAPGPAILSFEVYIAGICVAFVPISIEISAQPSVGDQTVTTAGPARMAFASYASHDRERVLDKLGALSAYDKVLKVFTDCLDLRPGESWKQRLELEIPKADLFLPFWSRAARDSPWVKWEWHTALAKRGLGAIQPMPLEAPALAPPPPGLASLHFNDIFLIVRDAERARRRSLEGS